MYLAVDGFSDSPPRAYWPSHHVLPLPARAQTAIKDDEAWKVEIQESPGVLQSASRARLSTSSRLGVGTPRVPFPSIVRLTRPPPPAPSPPAVVDVHQTWAGPCKAIHGTFKRIFFDHGDKPMKFYTADASKVTALNEHVGTCEPRFIFFRDGQQVATVKGVDAPGSPPSSSRRWASSSDDDEREREHQRAAGWP